MTANLGLVLVALIGVIGPLSRACATAPGRAKLATSGAYATGQYRNLFAEQGRSQQQIDAKIDASFQQLFHSDPKTQAIYYETGTNADGPLAYTTDVANHDAPTEGMSYGMMIAVQMDKKHEFDAI